MKAKHIYLVLCLTNVVIALGQEGTILPLNHSSSINVLAGTYEKDVDNNYGPYIGNWEGTWDGKKLIISLEKVTKQLFSYPNGYYYYRDILAMRYKVVDIATQNILDDTFNLLPHEAKITSTSAGTNNKISFVYIDEDRCSNTGNIRLEKTAMSLDHLTYYYGYGDFWIDVDCPYLSQEDIPISIPTGTLTLTRIN